MTAPRDCSRATAIWPWGKRARSWATQACKAAGFCSTVNDSVAAEPTAARRISWRWSAQSKPIQATTSGTLVGISISVLLGEDTWRRELGRGVALIGESSIGRHLSIRFGSERPVPLEALSVVVERRADLFVAERGVSSSGSFTAVENLCPDGAKEFTELMTSGVPSAPRLEL